MVEKKYRSDRFAKRLAELRGVAGKTQVELANELAISDKTYSKWETGESEPGFDALVMLAEYFGVSPEFFFTESDEARSNIAKTLLGELDVANSVEKAFEAEYELINGVAKKCFEQWNFGAPPDCPIPPNRVTGGDNGITCFQGNNVCLLMFNGDEANISVSQLPAKNNFKYLTDHRRKQISELLALLSDEDMIKCLVCMMDADFSPNYTAKHLAKSAGVCVGKVEELLHLGVKQGLCSVKAANIGNDETEIFNTWASQLIPAILTLAYICIPATEWSGRNYVGIPMSWHVFKEV
ncbi:MAG: helix-turn-helix transcriptional regulator [Clostridia bacterium]|nr:helix-turn-helix transcriptional regulator [Clostridia bacterium]